MDPWLKQFSETVKNLAAIEPKTFFGSEERAKFLGLDNEFETLRGIKVFFTAWTQVDPTFLSRLDREHLTNWLQELSTVVERMKSVQDRSDADNQRGRFMQTWTEIFTKLAPKLVYLENRKELFNLAVESRNVLTAVKKQGDEAFDKWGKEFTDLSSKVQSVAADVEKLAERAGIAKQAEFFANEAKEHKRGSVGWIIVLCILLGVAAAYVIKSVEPALGAIKADAKPAEIFHIGLPRVLIFSALYFGMVWVARNYAAARHNYIVNKHRALALSTFRVFADAAEQDARVKNAVLLQATTAIFSGQVSGYLKDEVVPQEKASIIEIFKDFTSK